MRLAIIGCLIVASSTASAAPGPLASVHAKLVCADCHDPGSVTSSPAKCMHCHAVVASRSLHVSPLVADSTCGSCHPDHRGPFADISGWPAIGGIDDFDHAIAGYRLVGMHADVMCAKCHTGPGVHFTGLSPSCASCHHSPHPDTKFFARACEACHSPMARSLNAPVIDHGAYPLGKHVAPKVACDGCHTAASGSGPADISCERCHAAASRHGERFKGRPCATCHRAATSWSPSSFDHSTTKFRLSFRHAELKCRACHRGSDPAEFERLPTDTRCIGCHAHRAVHADPAHPKGRYTDDQCLQCHLNPGPPPPRRPMVELTHGANGDYPLTKGHKNVPCAECHASRDARGRTVFDHVDQNCTSSHCHDGDPHRGTTSPQCTLCHVGGTWEALKFDHGRVFPLRGAHADEPCSGCHERPNEFAVPVECVGCHARDDAHRGSLGTDCGRCHRDTGEITFDHDRARFKLDGKHKAVACADCHPKGELKPRPTSCAGCHPVPTFHRTARSELAWYDDDCGGCHSARGW